MPLLQYPLTHNQSSNPYHLSTKITEIQKIYSCLRKRITINFYWCPGHVNIFGNEAADNLAKLAVKCGRTPNFSAKLLRSHTKMLLKQQSLDLWQNMWTTSTNGRLTFKFVPNIRRNSIAHANFSYKLTVLTGYGKFNMYRQFYDHTLSAYCVCEKAFDDGEHYLFYCPLYSVEREVFLAAVNSLTSSPLKT